MAARICSGPLACCALYAVARWQRQTAGKRAVGARGPRRVTFAATDLKADRPHGYRSGSPAPSDGAGRAGVPAAPTLRTAGTLRDGRPLPRRRAGGLIRKRLRRSDLRSGSRRVREGEPRATRRRCRAGSARRRRRARPVWRRPRRPRLFSQGHLCGLHELRTARVRRDLGVSAAPPRPAGLGPAGRAGALRRRRRAGPARGLRGLRVRRRWADPGTGRPHQVADARPHATGRAPPAPARRELRSASARCAQWHRPEPASTGLRLVPHRAGRFASVTSSSAATARCSRDRPEPWIGV